MAKRTLLLVQGLVLVLTIAPARAADDPSAVPAALQGIWGKDGRCDVPADRLTIASHTAGWGDGPFKPVVYSPAENAVHWDEEYDVDNFVPSLAPDILVHNTEGFGTSSGRVGYARCGAGMARVLPWPPFKPGPVAPGPEKPSGQGASGR